jgi:SPP1 family predicted phage head-tail adaptor
MNCLMKKPVNIILKKTIKDGIDDWGNPLTSEVSWIVFADRMSVTSAEFYRASNQGLKPSVVFEIYEKEFDNADLIIFDDVEYSIIRTYQKTLDRLEVVCERKVGND